MSNVSLVDGHIDEPKMTDEEIIKALECIKSSGLRKLNKCGSCKYSKSNVCNIWDLLKDALDLIKRKDAEIEELKKGFTADADFFASEYDFKIKSEAIKEFAERLKESCYTYSDICGYQSTVVDVYHIDNFVKEMVGE